MAAPAPPVLFDPARRRARLARAAGRFSGADFLHTRAAASMVESLEAILRDFKTVVDLSPLSGPFAGALADSPIAAARLGPVQARPQASPGSAPLPVADGSVDLVVSVLGLHWADDLPGALAQVRRALRPDGLFLGALSGLGTLVELREVLAEAELTVRGGVQPRVSPFADGRDGASLLQRAGFALPVVDVDRVVVRYDDLFALVRDLRAMGETSALAGPVRPLTREIAARAAALYAARHADPDGRVRATFEIVHLAGWAPHDSQQKPLPRGSAKTRLADALGVREGGPV